MVSDKGHLEWKKMYFKLSRCYPHREQYSDTLHFCTHCHILFWKVYTYMLRIFISLSFTLIGVYKTNMLWAVKLHLEVQNRKKKHY